jgi:hypothetical protein
MVAMLRPSTFLSAVAVGSLVAGLAGCALLIVDPKHQMLRLDQHHARTVSRAGRGTART